MLVLITYDVSTISAGGKTRLRKIAKICVNYGQRVQNSVFELNVDYGRILQIKEKILKIMSDKEDSVRFYYLGNKWKGRVEHFGINDSFDMEDVLLL